MTTSLEIKLDCAEDFDVYENQWFETPQVRVGFQVYRISNSQIAKVVKAHDFWHKYDSKTKKERIKLLLNECLLHTQAYQLGISVPKPEGIFQVTIRTEDSEIITPAFVMEYVPGSNLVITERERPEDFDSALTQRDNELEKATSAGFIPKDIQWENNIWNSERKKLYLIDLEQWKVQHE